MGITLSVESRQENIKKSINGYISTNISGLNIDWGQPNFKEEGLERWVQTRILIGDRAFGRLVDNAESKGNRTQILININLFEKYPARKNIYQLDRDKETVLEGLFFQDIPINDYDASGSPQRGLLQVREIINDLEIDGGEESGLTQWNLLLGGWLTEKWS